MRPILLLCLLATLQPARSKATGLPAIPPSVLEPARMAVDDGQDPMGHRLFRTTTTRRQVNLAGWWEFVTDPEDAGEVKKYFENFPRPETSLWVPGTWNAHPRYWQYIGPAWYRRTMDMPETGSLRLLFAGVFYRARVWLDGRYLGEHEGGYLPFCFLVKELSRGAHTIVLRADNRLSDTTLPKQNVDWFSYGGIDRPVYGEIVPETWIERFHVAAAPGAGKAILTVQAAVRSGNRRVRQPIGFYVDGRELYRSVREIPPEGGSIQFETALDLPNLWSPEDPHLYSARLTIGGADDQFVRFGVRSVSTRGGELLLNGRRFKLRGVNRHEDHPDWGSALPPHLVRQDIEIIKRVGANAVRAHYPLQDMFLDYCDQNGLVFMSEVPSWQYRREQLALPAIQEKIKKCFTDMVERDRTHPSILTWSLGNEWPNPDDSYEVIRSLLDFARRMDKGHLITFITGGPNVWRVQGLVDVICVNWAQYQWYDPITYLDEAEGRKSIRDLARIHERYPDKPVILTEFGGAESQAGWHNWGNVKWSEEYQARNVEDSGRHALQQAWISGGCVWQFCDSRSSPERILAGRLHGWNTKGLVDAYRNPKMAFYSLQRLFKSWAEEAAPDLPSSGR